MKTTTRDMVHEIRASKEPQAVIASRLGISQSTISRVRSGKVRNIVPQVGLLGETNTNLSYLAGLIDGEGCIKILVPPRPKGPCVLTVSITQTYTQNILRRIHETFGGHLRTKQSKGKTIAQWQLGGKDGAELLEMVLPYLVGKKHQATIALELQGKSSTTRSARAKIAELKTLKREVML